MKRISCPHQRQKCTTYISDSKICFAPIHAMATI